MCEFPSFPVINAKYLQNDKIQFKINSTYMGEKNEDCPVFSFLYFLVYALIHNRRC